MEVIVDRLTEFRESLLHHELLSVSALLILGYFFGKLAAAIRLPEITGYIIAGFILGDSALGIIHHEMGKSLQVITDVALGLIALTIGGEFLVSKLRRMGGEVLILTASQIFLTLAVVTLSLWLLRLPLPFALMLGAIATATAPAATVAVVQSLRAHGPFVDRLYGIVALDDAGAVIIFGVIFAIVSGILTGGGAALGASGPVGHSVEIGSAKVVLGAFKEVLFSILMGAAVGWIIHALTYRKGLGGELTIIALGWVFLLTAISLVFHLSPLLSNIAAGMTIINLSPRNYRIFRNLEPLTPPIYALFFAIAGTKLNPGIFAQKDILIYGMVFIAARAFGKISGVWGGAILAKSRANVRKYLGICMLPQAGVAIGLMLMIQTSPIIALLDFEQRSFIAIMVNIILLSVFFNELSGPPLSKLAIVRALDMEENSEEDSKP